mgnify:CR=1 FL=1
MQDQPAIGEYKPTHCHVACSRLPVSIRLWGAIRSGMAVDFRGAFRTMGSSLVPPLIDLHRLAREMCKTRQLRDAASLRWSEQLVA